MPNTYGAMTMLSELKLEVAKLREDHKLIINNVIDYYEKKVSKTN